MVVLARVYGWVYYLTMFACATRRSMKDEPWSLVVQVRDFKPVIWQFLAADVL